MSSADIYREIILDYYRNPRNYGKIENPDISQKDSNPLCGDELEMHINLRDNQVSDVKFTGKGCAISQASASMLTELIMGKDFDFVKKLTKEDILENLGLHDLGPARIKCALLSLKVLKYGIYSYVSEKLNDTVSADKIKEEASGLF
ncbi:MAG: SUF system NifU family Fe-S cluster assembly protein [Thaumarchaeota archaeon]|nr:SUF system NifU family Fe-S cluster assembly protein [Nitrososphaerota archaeon]MBI3641410.1 SUF system NifU family Fe-S cluster assembly protein [Nitrososphaerota archaeon]